MAGKSRLAHIPIEKIRPGEIALRGVDQDEIQFQQLADSVKTEGILSPISVREKQDAESGELYYELIDGTQRYTAAKLAGFTEVPAQIMDKDDEEVMIAQIAGNAKRVEMKPVQYANQIQKLLIAKPTMTMNEMSDLLHSSTGWLDSILKLRQLHESLKPLVDDGHISLANAFVLAKLPPEEQLAYAEDAQTKPAAEFTGPVLDRAKQIKTAMRQGKDAGEVQFTPIIRPRKIKDLEEALKDATLAEKVTRPYMASVPDSGITDITSANAGFQLGLQWAARVDPESLEKSRSEFEAKKRAANEEKIRKDAERANKKQKEAEDRATKARQEAEAAQKLVPQA